MATHLAQATEGKMANKAERNLIAFLQKCNDTPVRPPHPYWCDDCGAKAPFTIPGWPIDHTEDCSRFGEDARQVYLDAVEYVTTTGESIP